jgi:RHS repeat-associated protein
LIDERKLGGTRPHALTGRDATTGGGPLETYSYDARGRLTESRAEDDPLIRSTTYTSFDLPRTMTNNGQTWTFAYDAFGNRVKKSGPDGVTFTLPGAYERHASGSGMSYTFDVTGPDGRIAQARSSGGTVSVDYQLADQLGSVAAIVSESGEIRRSFFYDPFGARIDSDGSPFSDDAGSTTRGFTGHEHDDSLGLINMKGRMYDPQLQRFLTPDPVVGDPMDSQSWNPYSYVLNSPLNYLDPSGYTAIEGNCENSPYMPECGGSGNLSGWTGGNNGYSGDSFNSYLGDPDGGWGARNFQRDMAEFYGAADAYGQGGVNGLAAYSRGNLARAMKGTQAEWGPGGYMAKATALRAAKSDYEGFRPAAAPTSSESVHDMDETKESLSELEQVKADDTVHSVCGDPHGLGDSGVFVQVCSHHNATASWSELIWYNDGLDAAYLGEIMMFDLGNGDDHFVESNCSAGAVESGASGSCFTGFGPPKSMHFGEVTYWSPMREEWVHGSVGPTLNPGGPRPKNAWW